jgi:sucrose phosphorylase
MSALADPESGLPSRRPFDRELHLSEPDYTRPLLELRPEQRQNIMRRLIFLYGKERAEACFCELERLMRVYYAHKPEEMLEAEKTLDPAERFTEKDVILITYGDLITSPQKKPLRALSDFLTVFMGSVINTIHILPFFPSSSDRGFSIIAYEEVDQHLGSWDDIDELSLRFRLMFDGVFNHVSASSRLFQEFLNGNPDFQDFFIRFSTRDEISDDHLHLILRPRVTDLLTSFNTIAGRQYVWTTFGPDQIDLNFKNEKVLTRIVEILLYYVRRGADMIRLDAITYLWSELGTTCAHLQQTHAVVQLFRSILDVVAPHVALVSEANVPHEEIITYFGKGSNEAQMVYNFALPPLVLLSFQESNCEALSRWAEKLEDPSDTATYFNFLDSHDGIGLLPIKNIVGQEQLDGMVRKALSYGGIISYREDAEGKMSPYEINTTWYSVLNREGDESVDLQVDRFIASRAIALVLQGVPGTYLPSLLGAQNDLASVLESGEPRSINRKSIDEEALIEKLGDRDSSTYKVASRFRELIEKRTETPAFHPNGSQRVLMRNPAVFSVVRTSPDGKNRVLALTNVSASAQEISFSEAEVGVSSKTWKDILTGHKLESAPSGGVRATLEPYANLWLTPA